MCSGGIECGVCTYAQGVYTKFCVEIIRLTKIIYRLNEKH